MKKPLYLVSIFIFLGCIGCSLIQQLPVQTGPKLIPVEGAIPGVPERVEFADYWIRISDNPDEVITQYTDTMKDMCVNMTGAIIGIVSYLILKRSTNKKKNYA